MNKLRITMLVLVIFGLGYEIYVIGSLAVVQAQVADALRKAMDGSEKSIAAHEKASQEVLTARQAANLASLTWGQERTVEPAQAINVQVVAGAIAINGIETGSWLAPVTVQDAAGQAQTLLPPVHVFALVQGASFYIGEFAIDPARLGPQSVVVIPRWNVSPEEFTQWNFSGGARFRTAIPVGGRSLVENHRQVLQRTSEEVRATIARIEEQKKLNTAATAALEKRRMELLGDPAAADNADHPEYKLGLVQALEDLEEDRNAVQIDVDALRRTIKAALSSREGLIDALKQIADSSRVKSSRLTQRPE